MKKKLLMRSLVVVTVLISLALILSPLTGCEKKKSAPGNSSKIVGFPPSFADLAEKITPAVVNISTTTIVKAPGSPFRHFFGPDDEGFRDFMRRFFGDVPDRELRQQSLGSGFIIDKSGLILTNNHVVERADEIKVKLADGREFKAKVIGRDPKTDLALIKISSGFKDLPTIALGDSDKMRVGDWVLAMGNPFGLEHTVTQGIISATGRVIGAGPYDNFLQTDAPINPGNSGGPLINLHGEVIGINTAIVATGQGIGFAIPSNLAKTIVAQLKEKGKVVRGWIGVSVQAVTPEVAQAFGLKEATGALVSDVFAGSPAEAAGVKRGDIITSFNGKKIKNMSDLPRIVAAVPVGKTVPVTLIRDGKELTLSIKVAELTEKRAAPQEELQGAGEIGIVVRDITPQLRDQLRLKDKTGVVVVDVAPGSPAEAVGFQVGDVIKEVNRTPVANVKEFNKVLSTLKKDRPALFLVKRGSQTFFISVRLS